MSAGWIFGSICRNQVAGNRVERFTGMVMDHTGDRVKQCFFYTYGTVPFAECRVARKN